MIQRGFYFKKKRSYKIICRGENIRQNEEKEEEEKEKRAMSVEVLFVRIWRYKVLIKQRYCDVKSCFCVHFLYLSV